jgi:L-ascorbate metabolism protein UlaG (beta-lactamase superfamily)
VAAVRVTLIGHATVLVEVDGVSILTDPLLRDRVTFLGARRRARHETEGLDAVLLSHFHRDHFDRRSLALLDRGAAVIGPPGTAKRVRRLGFADVAELGAGDSTSLDGVTIRATKALHGRMPPRFRAPAIGFVIAGSRRTYFAGDTDLFPDMAELAADELDVALLPVAGWGPRLGAGHLDTRRAAEALRLIRPKVAVPIHWGVLHPIGLGRFKFAYLTKPGEQFAAHAAELAPDVDVRLLDPGESLEL